MMFVGEGRAGKTSALRSMLGLPYVDTASTVGAEMFDVSVETAVQWSRQDSNIPELHRVAARWAAWRKENGGKAPPVVESASASLNGSAKTTEVAAAMDSDDNGNAAASASATASMRSDL